MNKRGRTGERLRRHALEFHEVVTIHRENVTEVREILARYEVRATH
jgi:low affinity Fe/Cu permease